MAIDKPGIYDISAEEYHADPCPTPSLSSSLTKVLVQETPLHAWTAHPRLNPLFERNDEDKFDLGNASHALILNDPKKFAILPFDDFRKKEAQEAKAAARAAGKIPLLTKHWDRVVAMVASGRDQLDSSADFARVFTMGKPEQTLIWCETEFQGAPAKPVWFRARLDWLPDDHTQPYDDFKSTESADPDVWSRIVFSVRHDIQASFYRRGIRALGLARQPQMRFVVQETSTPNCVSVMKMSAEAMELADRDVERAIRKWRWCTAQGWWPGYPAKVHTIMPPAWLETQRMDRESRIEEISQGEKVDPDLLALGFRAQAPI